MNICLNISALDRLSEGLLPLLTYLKKGGDIRDVCSPVS